MGVVLPHIIASAFGSRDPSASVHILGVPTGDRVPDGLVARVPQTKDYRYAATSDRVLLVGTSRIVAGVFAGH